MADSWLCTGSTGRFLETLKRHRVYWLFAICTALYLLPFMPLLLNCGDEGSIVYAAVRVLHGQVFARDFFEVMGPGSIYYLALFFKVFGISFWTARLDLFLTSLGTAILCYFLTRQITERHRLVPCLFLAATSFGLSWPAVTHHLDSNFFSLISVALVAIWRKLENAALLAAAGCSTALVALIHQPKGAYLLLAIALYLLAVPLHSAHRLRTVLIVFAGFVCVGSVTLIYFWSQGALHDLFYANITWPLSHYQTVNSVPYGQQLLSTYWERWSFKSGLFDPLFVVASIFITPFLIIALLPLLLLLLAWIIGFHKQTFWSNASPLLPLYCLAAIALWLSELHRMDITHLQFGSLLFIIILIYQLNLLHRVWSEYAVRALAYISILVATVNALVVLTATRPSSTNVGTVRMLKQDPIIPFLCSQVTPGQNIFIYPYRPMDYFLSGANNPTRYSLLVYNYNTDEEFRDAIHSLDLARPQYVIWNTRFEEVYGDYLPASRRTSAQALIMEPYLKEHYYVAGFHDEYAILKRDSDEHSR